MDDDGVLLVLGDQLHRTRRRAGRLKQRISGGAEAWQRWSAAIDEALNLVVQISRTPASDIRGVSIKLDAVVWLLTHDGAVLDAGAQRRLQTLGREVRRLAE